MILSDEARQRIADAMRLKHEDVRGMSQGDGTTEVLITGLLAFIEELESVARPGLE